jgi:type III pantothenate kinase
LILAVDAGNTRVKWALHDGRQFISDGWVAQVDLASLDTQWAALPAPAAIVIANVAGHEVGQKLRAATGRWQTIPRWACSVRSQAGVFNRYDDPSQLGVDRWAALIGARSVSSRACVVVNAGTATTIDALAEQGEFIGGLIVPGFDLMHESLAANTAGLSSARGDFKPFPNMTRDAITTGALQALCGAVERMREAMLSAGHKDPELIFSGGAGELLARHMGKAVRVVDKLVLTGLVRIAMESR